jgi:perosamine synthetase
LIQISPVRLGEEEEKLVIEVLRSGRLSQGPMVERFESEVSALVGTKHAIATSSGSSALVTALAALDVGPGKEVVTSPFTFGATLNAILFLGGTARFADISENDYAMNPEIAESLLNEATTTILPVHLYGLPADMPAFERIAARLDLRLAEDAAQAIGADVGGRRAGSFDVGCFSFYATKNVTTGEGGVITTNDDGLADRAKQIRNQGMKARYEYSMLGNNYRMTEMQAALGIPQLARLSELNRTRRENARTLSEGLQDLPGIVIPRSIEGRTHVYHQYTLRVTDESPLSRDEISTELARRGIETGIYYPKVVYDYACFRTHPGVVADPVPVAEKVSQEVLSLPVHPWLEEKDLAFVIESVRDLLGA